MESICWRRLDPPGHDACRLVTGPDGWQLEGVAVFREAGEPAALRYALTCDAAWQSRRGTIEGCIGSRSLAHHIERTLDGTWRLDGAAVAGLAGCVDLDLGFTPATNLTQLRRVALAVGAGIDVPVAWFDTASGALTRLEQRYERRTATTYWYDAPRFGYRALLTVRDSGFVEDYPALWAAEP